MSNGLKLLLIGVSMAILAALITFATRTLVNVKQTTNSQTSALSEMQQEFEQSDLLALSGQLVSSAEAYSLARKYAGDADILMETTDSSGGTIISTLTAADLTKGTFGTVSNWTVLPEMNESGVLLNLKFRNPYGSGSMPSTTTEMLSQVAAVLGCDADWQHVSEALESGKAAEDYRKQLATILGIDDSSSWEEVRNTAYNKLTSGSVSVDCQKEVIGPNGTAVYSGSNPTFVYLRSDDGKTGMIDFTRTSLKGQLFGDFTADDVSWDVSGRVTSLLGYTITVTFVKTGY